MVSLCLLRYFPALRIHWVGELLFCGGESLIAKKKDILAQIYSTWRPTKKYRLEEEREREVAMHHDFAY